MPSLKRLQRQFQDVQDTRQPVRKKFHALIGHPDGTTIDDPEAPGFVFVRIDGDGDRVRHALCRSVLPLYNQPVIVAYSDERPRTLEVIDLNVAALPSAPDGGPSWDGSANLGKHASQHALSGGDTVWIQTKQILPLRTRPAVPASMRVYVESGAYQYGAGFNYWPGGYTSDMTAHIPSTADMQLFRVIYVDAATNALAYVNSAETASDLYLANYEDVLDLVPTGCVPLSAIRLVNGQTTIVEADIYELRSFVSSAPGTSAASGVLWENIVVVAKSGGDYTTLTAGLGAAAAGDTALGAPGTYAENATLVADVQIVAIGGVGSVIVQPAAGVPLTLPASGQCVVTGIRATPPAGQVAVSFPAASTAFLQLIRGYLDADGAASLDASAAGATAEVDLIDCTVEGNVLLKSIGVIIDTRIAGSVTQSAGAGNLTIDGGNIDGDLTHVAGSTITLRNLPRIAGTVSGAGTLVGAYLNSSGHIVFTNGTAMSGFANPTGLIGMAAVNGVATTATRSDATHAIDPAIAPTWTGLHTFSASSGDRAIYVTRSVATTGAEEYGGYVTLDATASQAGFARYGLNVIAESSHTSGTVDVTGAILAQVQATGSGGTTDNSASLETRAVADTGAQITTHQHLYIANATGAGALGTQYGVYIENLTKGSVNDYGIYIAGAGTYAIWVDSGTVQFDGSLNIGSASGATSAGQIFSKSTASALEALRLEITGTTTPNVKQTWMLSGLTNSPRFEWQMYAPSGAGSEHFRINFSDDAPTSSAGLVYISKTGLFGINTGTSTPAVRFHINEQDAATSTVIEVMRLAHNSTGTPAGGFGASIRVVLESDTTPDQTAGLISWGWVTATHASRKATVVHYAYDTAAREALRLEASGTAAMIGFLGAAAAIRQTGGAATAGATYTATEQGMLQKAYDALRTFGLLT